jgi:hypothetical protein
MIPPNETVMSCCRRKFDSSRLLLAFGALIVAIVFCGNYNWIVTHFYVNGAYLLDSGLLADLIWRNQYFNPRLAAVLGGENLQRSAFLSLA